MFKPIQIADDLKKYGGYIPACARRADGAVPGLSS
jgi:hypothetical protein